MRGIARDERRKTRGEPNGERLEDVGVKCDSAKQAVASIEALDTL